jgi:hypothetical protein
MNVDEIVQQLKDERIRLDTAIQALEGVGGSATAAKRREDRMKQPEPITKQRIASARNGRCLPLPANAFPK